MVSPFSKPCVAAVYAAALAVAAPAYAQQAGNQQNQTGNETWVDITTWDTEYLYQG
jgi:hypothetical protein